MLVSIHCEPRIGWQGPFAQKISVGLTALGVPHEITARRIRGEGLPILLGTSCWRAIEATGRPYLLVDRCSFGDTDQWVSLVRDGHGRRGDHRVTVDPARWERYGEPLRPWQYGPRVVLCGQTETYSPKWRHLADWYAAHKEATHFRRHPAGINLTGLTEVRTWANVGQAITLNSSVAVEAILAGVPTTVDDEGGMAWPGFAYGAERREWLHWLACTQWTHDEIAEGTPWAHMLSD